MPIRRAHAQGANDGARMLKPTCFVNAATSAIPTAATKSATFLCICTCASERVCVRVCVSVYVHARVRAHTSSPVVDNACACLRALRACEYAGECVWCVCGCVRACVCGSSECRWFAHRAPFELRVRTFSPSAAIDIAYLWTPKPHNLTGSQSAFGVDTAHALHRFGAMRVRVRVRE